MSITERFYNKTLLLRERLRRNSYAKYLKGRRVAIIGPAETVKGKAEGAEIDKYDVVARFNTTMDFMPFSEEMAADIGSKTTVLYVCPSSVASLAKKKAKKIEGIFSGNQIEYLTYQNNHKNHQYRYCEFVYEGRIQPYLKRMHKKGYKVKGHYSNPSMALLSTWLTHHAGVPLVARTGFLSIFDAILHGATAIMIRGMTFYHAGGHMFRPMVGELKPTKQHQLLGCPHDSTKELELLKIIMGLFDTKFDLDDSLTQLIGE